MAQVTLINKKFKKPLKAETNFGLQSKGTSIITLKIMIGKNKLMCFQAIDQTQKDLNSGKTNPQFNISPQKE